METSKKLVLIGWDGADWNHINPLLDQGLMPNLQFFIDNGVIGNIETLNPILSPMLWNSIATGKCGDEHGILNFTEPNPTGKGFRPYSSVSRKTKALWNIFTQNNLSSNIVNWWASFPAEQINGCIVTNNFVRAQKSKSSTGWDFFPGTFHPEEIQQPVGELRFATDELDESAILPFVPNAAQIDQSKDKNLEQMAKTLAECISLQGAATWLLENRPANFNAFYFEGIDHFCHGAMHFAPPKLPNVSQEKFDLYKGVVDGAYQFHDMMLGAIMRMIDDDTYLMLCSDHGFQSGATRPMSTPNEPAGPAYWHRPLGIFALKGPGIKKDERVYGASLLDVTPTILSIFDLPVGRDMPGKVLVNAFEKMPEIEFIPSWDEVEGESGMHPDGFEVDQEQSSELVKQFVELGYIEDPGEDLELAAVKTQIEIDYNLARVYLSRNFPDKALPILKKLVADSPWENRFILHYARCLFEAGYLQQAKDLIGSAFPENKRTAATLVLLGRINVQLGNYAQGIDFLEQAQRKSPNLKGVYLELARVLFRVRKWDKAIECARRELDRYPDCPISMQIAGSSLVKKGEYEPAIDLLLDSVGIRYQNPQAHYYLGAAFLGMEDIEKAIIAFSKAVNFQPNLVTAHRQLSRLYSQQKNPSQANYHLQQSIVRREAIRTSNRDNKQRKTEIWELPDLTTPEERLDILTERRPRNKPNKKEKSGKTFVLVSGLPRSGTSLMMQMLNAGGLSPMTDGLRTADLDNPEGYYEWEAIKGIKKHPDILDEEGVDQKAIKAISMLLPQLPENHDYLVVFMDRPIPEVVASQYKMIERSKNQNNEFSNVDEQESQRQMAAELNRHRNSVRQWIAKSPNFKMINIMYGDLVGEPQTQVNLVIEFLGKERLPTADKMKSVINQDLYRQRKSIVDRY